MGSSAPASEACDPAMSARDLPGNRDRDYMAGTVMTRRALRRYPPRELSALSAALAGPLAASAVLLPFPPLPCCCW
jgi:hypothetical protein